MMKQTSALAVSPSAASVTKYKISNLKDKTEKGTQANMSFCCVCLGGWETATMLA